MDPAGERARIEGLLARGRVEAALEQLRHALDADAEQPDLQLLYGRVLASAGRLGDSVWPLRRAAASGEHFLEANLLLARVLLAMGSVDDAVAAADRVLAESPEQSEALALRARGHLAARREEEALRDARRLSELSPEDAEAHITLAMAYLGDARVDAAREALQRARGLAPSADHDEGLEARLCAAEASLLGESGQTPEAEAHFAGCLAAHPTGRVVIDAAVSYYAGRGRSERAIEILREAVARSPDALAHHIALGHWLRRTGDAQAARRLLEDFAARDPGVGGLLALVDHHVARRELSSALAALDAAVARLSDAPLLLRLAQADLATQLGAHGRARKIAADLPSGYAELIEGRVLLAEQQPAAALEQLERGLRHWPQNATARWLAGQAAEQLSDIERAVLHYREAVRSDAGSTDAALRLASLYLARHEPERALAMVRRRLEAGGADPETYRRSLALAAQLGRTKLLASLVDELERASEGWAEGEAEGLEEVAEAVAANGQAEAARRISALAAALRSAAS